MGSIVLGVAGQTLTHTPMGVPSSVVFVLEDLVQGLDTPTRTIASGPADVASWELTSTATAGVSQLNGRRISVASTAGATIGEPAVIIAPDGTRELIEIAAISTNSYLEASATIAGEYPPGSTIAGVLISATVPDDFAADETRFKSTHALRVTWVYDLDGRLHVRPELVTWVRHTVAADQAVGEAVKRLSRLYPDLRERWPTDNNRPGLDVAAALLADDVADDIRARGRDPEAFMTGTRGRGLLEARILQHAAELGWSPGQQPLRDWLERTTERYALRLEQLTQGLPGAATADVNLATDTSSGVPSTALGGLSLRL